MYEWFKDIVKEIDDDIIKQTKEDYNVFDLITLQSLLTNYLGKIGDHYYMSDINVSDYVALKFALKVMISQISWSIYHGYYKDLNWLEEFHKSIEESL